MRHFFFLLLISTLVITGCKKADNKELKSSSLIVGSWRLNSYSGGIAGFRHRAANAGTVVKLVFGSDGTYRQYINGSIQLQDKYTVLNKYQFSKDYVSNALQVSDDIVGAYSITTGTQDTLFITPVPNWPDAMTSEYVKIK
ncbi:MAG: hypothetical protein EOP45_04410 [Sphingobacteriaceae bacterium]|nr:MAG: hypothetical protein EOP45_04410 [Sphingobacteriaceae bacterium]